MKIVLGIGGSIAAYKALELVRLLIRQGHEVKVVLTSAGAHFVTPLSCQTLSGNDVYQDQFVLTRGIKHLSLNEWGDALVIAPATADLIGKAAAGIADDLLTTTLVSFTKPVLFVPAMDEGMWSNPRVRRNVALLEADGAQCLMPLVGPLASGKIGRGRFPPAELIAKKIETVIAGESTLAGVRCLVTGGRTEADLDTARIISNRSSGRMARELLIAALCRGADVKGIMGETSVAVPEGVPVTRVRTSREMLKELVRDLPGCDLLIMAAAVNDYEPVTVHHGKAHQPRLVVRLRKAPDLLKTISRQGRGKVVVGFSLEDRLDRDRARHKLLAKKLDVIAFNTPRAIGGDATDARVMTSEGRVVEYPSATKWALANRILDLCRTTLKAKQAASIRRPRRRM